MQCLYHVYLEEFENGGATDWSHNNFQGGFGHFLQRWAYPNVDNKKMRHTLWALEFLKLFVASGNTYASDIFDTQWKKISESRCPQLCNSSLFEPAFEKPGVFLFLIKKKSKNIASSIFSTL